MRCGFKIREEGQPILFTSNKEVLYPKIQSLVEKQKVMEGDYQRYTHVMKRLLDILEELEIMLNQKRIKHKYILTNGEELEMNNHLIKTALKAILQYCEPLDEESIALLYHELNDIEIWL